MMVEEEWYLKINPGYHSHTPKKEAARPQKIGVVPHTHVITSEVHVSYGNCKVLGGLTWDETLGVFPEEGAAITK